MYSINRRHPMSEYFPIMEYSDICTIMSQIAQNLYKSVASVFNIRASVSIDTKEYTVKIGVYDI